MDIKAAYDKIYDGFGNVGEIAQKWFKAYASTLYDAGFQVILCPSNMKFVA